MAAARGFVRRDHRKGDGLPRLAAVGVCPTCNTIWEHALTSSALDAASEMQGSANGRRSTFWRWKPARSVSMKAD